MVYPAFAHIFDIGLSLIGGIDSLRCITPFWVIYGMILSPYIRYSLINMFNGGTLIPYDHPYTVLSDLPVRSDNSLTVGLSDNINFIFSANFF